MTTKTIATTAPYALAHRAEFDADWRDGNAYHMGESGDFSSLDDAVTTAKSLDETCGWDVIVVERDGGNKPRVVYG